MDDDAVAILENEPSEAQQDRNKKSGRKGRSVIETYVGATNKGTVKGLNFATFRPVGERSDLLVAGQLNSGRLGGNRFETEFSFSPKKDHKIRLRGSIADIGSVGKDNAG